MPRQMFTHALNVVKGWMPSDMQALDKIAKLSANVTVSPVWAGRVVHLNSDGEFELGCRGTQMAIFLRQNSDDYDVLNDGDTDWVGLTGRGKMSGLVASGGYEVETTEYNASVTYVYNDPVRAEVSNSDSTTGGRLTNHSITVNTNAICGVVSKPPFQNAHKVNVLRVWTVYCPGTEGNG